MFKNIYNDNNLIYICIIFIFILLKILFSHNEYFLSEPNKYVCMYAYYEKNKKYKENLQYFLDNGLLDNVDYYIIINGKSTVKIPSKPNINVIYRDNIGYDFGAWSYCVNKYLKKEYDYYIFLNTSVKGPYLKNTQTNWLDEFLKLFNKPDIKLVGTSINIFENCGETFIKTKLQTIYKHKGPYTHVQSMFFILDKEGFKYLKHKKFFDINYNDFIQVIIHKEIGLSQLILENGWNINSILNEYKDYDYRNLKVNINTHGEDPYHKGAYFGGTIKPYNSIFFKNNRF